MKMTLCLCAVTAALPASPARPDCVALLHGLARTEDSLIAMAAALEAQGFAVVNEGYPSTDATMPAFQGINGPAGLELGTDAASVPLALPDPEYDLGVIAGNSTLNPV